MVRTFVFDLLKEIYLKIDNGMKLSPDRSFNIFVIGGNHNYFGDLLIKTILKKYINVSIYKVENEDYSNFQKYEHYHFLKCDLTDRNSIHEFIDTNIKLRQIRIDILINNLQEGVHYNSKTAEMFFDDEQFRKCIYANLLSVMLITKATLTTVRNRQIYVINITPDLSNYKNSCNVGYIASKGSMDQYHDALSSEIEPYGKCLLVYLPMKDEINENIGFEENSIYVNKLIRCIENGMRGKYKISLSGYDNKGLIAKTKHVISEWV